MFTINLEWFRSPSSLLTTLVRLSFLVCVVSLAFPGGGCSQTDYLTHRLNQLRTTREIYEPGVQGAFSDLRRFLSAEHLEELLDTKLYVTLEDNVISATAYGYTNRIHVSAATVLFLEELATTLAWYESASNTHRQPIVNYVLLLRRNMRKGELEREIQPSIYDALGVPGDDIWARDDSDFTKTIAQNYLKSAFVWILAHEMGHIALGHFDEQKDFADHLERTQHNRELEMAADSFATELMSRARLAPLGMAVTIMYYSLLYPIRLEFNDEEDWQAYLAEETHPIWPERLERIADLIRKYGHNFFRSSDQIEFYAGSIDTIAANQMAKGVLDAMIVGSEGLTFENIMTFEPLKSLDRNTIRAIMGD